MKEIKPLLTKSELAKRWSVDTRTIDKWERNNIIQRVKGIPVPRYNIEHILKIEETDISEFSPLERKKLERENEKLKLENENLKNILNNIFIESSKIVKFN